MAYSMDRIVLSRRSSKTLSLFPSPCNLQMMVWSFSSLSTWSYGALLFSQEGCLQQVVESERQESVQWRTFVATSIQTAIALPSNRSSVSPPGFQNTSPTIIYPRLESSGNRRPLLLSCTCQV